VILNPRRSVGRNCAPFFDLFFLMNAVNFEIFCEGKRQKPAARLPFITFFSASGAGASSHFRGNWLLFPHGSMPAQWILVFSVAFSGSPRPF